MWNMTTPERTKMENHQDSISKSRHIKLISLIVLLIVFCLWVSATHSSKIQNPDKIIEKGEDYKPPLKITLVKSKFGIIETNKKISAGDDWLRGLTIRVRNDSGKTVTSVTIEIQFRRPEYQAGALDLLTPIEYGPNPFAPFERNSPLPAEPILPNQTKDITLSEQNYDALRAVLDVENYPASIKAIKIQVRTVGFNDGTAWHKGKIFKRNPNDPDKWIRENQSQSSKKKARMVRQSRIL
jgi:hypothetical protein